MFNDYNSKPLEIRKKMKITLGINQCVTYKMRYSFELID